MKIALAMLLMIPALAVQAADAEDSKPKTIAVPDGDTLDVVAPEGWSLVTIQPDPKLPPTLALSSAKREATLRITFIPDKNGTFKNKEKLQGIIQAMSQQYVGG